MAAEAASPTIRIKAFLNVAPLVLSVSRTNPYLNSARRVIVGLVNRAELRLCKLRAIKIGDVTVRRSDNENHTAPSIGTPRRSTQGALFSGDPLLLPLRRLAIA
jgi:hypothetical protein